MIIQLVILVLLGSQTALTSPQNSQAASQGSITAAALTNADVLKLKKAGFSDDLIIAAIKQASRREFVLDVATLVLLKQQGLSDRVVEAMMSAAGTPPGAAGDAKAPPAPESALPSGVYYAPDGTLAHLIQLEPTTFSQGKLSSWKTTITYGIAKAQWKAIVAGAEARQRVSPGRVTFYFEFGSKDSAAGSGAFGGWLSAATSPNEFILAEMDKKSNGRELVVGESNLYTSSTGARAEDLVPVDIERVTPGLYRVTTKEVLEKGEFCFFYSGGVSTFGAGVVGKLFDFGIDSPREPAAPK